MASETLLETKDLTKYFPVSSGFVFGRVQAWVKAVDGISFSVAKGETLGVVGESGCGKTTTAKLILAQEAATSGQIEFKGQDTITRVPRRKDKRRRLTWATGSITVVKKRRSTA